MKNRAARIVLSLVIFTAYYCVLFYMAQTWYRASPDQVARVFGSPVLVGLLYSAFVVVPVHLLGLVFLAYKRVLNPGEFVMCLMAPIALGYVFFPAKP